MREPFYRRVVLKLSGEAFKGKGDSGAVIDQDVVRYLAREIKISVDNGVEISLVVGGGNIWRGADQESAGMDRSTADSAGMLATIINALALQDGLEKHGVEVRTQTAIPMSTIAEPYIRRRAMRHLEKGRVVIFAAGTGNPYFSTDTAAGLRALEVDAKALIMAKNNIDGIYTDDPNKNPEATKIDEMTYIEALEQRTGALDSTVLSLCMDNKLPIVVFDMFKEGNLELALSGAEIGTLISESTQAA
ncbi:MAG: UMP kinase [Chloroflexi bacterium]|nr:UMP kinase [Chloroflexota bacterium]